MYHIKTFPSVYILVVVSILVVTWFIIAGMMAEVTSTLTSVGITICSCVVSGVLNALASVGIIIYNRKVLFFSLSLLLCINWSHFYLNILNEQAEIDRRRGMGVMLFHIEGSFENLVSFYWPTLNFHFFSFCYSPDLRGAIQENASSSVDLILGVLGWSTGCSWPSSLDNHHFLEC